MDHGQLRILPLASQAAARLQQHLFIIDEGDGANAIPLDFEEPLLTGGRFIHERRGHRLDGLWHPRRVRAFYPREVNVLFFLTAVFWAAGATPAPAARFAGLLLAQTRSE